MKRLILVILILALLCGCSSAPAASTPAASTPAATEHDHEHDHAEHSHSLAPDFTVYDLQGKPVKLSDFQGIPVVVNFWASWCGPCKSEMPDFEEVCKELEGKVQFMMVNLTDGTSETVESAAAFLTEAGYTFPVFFDTDQEAATQYGISSIPATFFIDACGGGVAYCRGAITREQLMQGIGMILPE